MATAGSGGASDLLDERLSETPENQAVSGSEKGDSDADINEGIESDNGSITVLESGSKVDAKSLSASDADNFSTRSRRPQKLSLISRESKQTDLEHKLTKFVTIEYRNLSKVQKQLQGQLSLDVMYENLDLVSKHVLPIVKLYDDLYALCDNETNKITGSVLTTYNKFITQAKALRATMDKIIDEMEAEEEKLEKKNNEDAKKELEEEIQRFERLLQETESITIDRQPSLDTQPPVETISREQSSEDESPGQEIQVCTVRPIEEPQVSAVRPLDADTERPPSEFSTITTFAEKFADKLAAEIRPARKSVEPEMFEGDPLKFNEWVIDLDTYFKDERMETAKEKLRHLKRFVGDEARECIQSHFIINTEAAYHEARSILQQRYGNKHNIVRRLRRQLDDWKLIGMKDRQGLRVFSDYLQQLKAAMTSMTELKILDDYSENEKMVSKLPDWLKLRWTRIVGNLENREDRYPNFKEFCTFIKHESDIMALPISQAISTQERRQPRQDNVSRKSYATAAAKEQPCIHCKLTNHDTADCYRLKSLSREETSKFVQRNGLCFRCFTKGHLYKDCSKSVRCLVCKKGHSTANHQNDFKREATPLPKDQAAEPKPQEKTPENQKTVMATSTGNSLVTMAIPVKVVAGNRSMLVYALLDNASDSCYATPALINRLKITANEIEPNITLHTMNGPEVVDLERFDNISLHGYMNSNTTKISVYERDIYCNKSQLPSPAKARRYPHLKDVADYMPPTLDIPVGLLIGSNHSEVIQPIDSRPAPLGTKGAPYAVKTLFGWTMGGGAEINRKRGTSFKTDLLNDSKLMGILEKDFHDIGQPDSYLSQDDLIFNNTMENHTSQNEDGNYVMPLPFREEPFLPNNRSQAEKRLRSLIRRFNLDPEYKKEYSAFVNKFVDSGHAELVTSSSAPGKTWYIPHFAVRHKKKGSLRVVFDASVKYSEVALNDVLLTGPDHMNSLLGILLRFRKEPYAVTCDIQQMFFNFVVEPQHRDFLRFLWLDDQDSVTDYRMKVHLFGAKSSPGVATFGLRRAAKDYSHISETAAEFLQENFYVDDGVVSLPTRDAAVQLIRAATEICSKANIRLHKFLSNDKEILCSIPESERGESTKGIDLFNENLPSERTLGMKWDMNTDTIYFNEPATAKEAPTKRLMLSTIAQVYDPMGIVAPVMLKGKRLLQQITASELPWDQLIGPDDAENWTRWVNQLQQLSNLNLKRCIKPDGNVTATELHHFSDASLNGYAACSYVRQIDADGNVETNLVLAKARVSPLRKATTIPRLELKGAVTATKLSATLRKELHVPITAEHFWTDSEIVLGYIRNDSKRFHMFVANRVTEIKLATQQAQWHHVSTIDNPADIASRGCYADILLASSMWFKGPKFLQDKDITRHIKQQPAAAILDDKDPEVREIKAMSTATTHVNPLSDRFNRYGNWETLVTSIATLKSCLKRRKWKHQPLKTEEMTEAEKFIISVTQQKYFHTEKELKTIKNLSPINDDLLRVGGRTQKSTQLSANLKHPAIIPKSSHIATLIGRHYHDAVYHLGYRSTIAAIREAGFLVISSTTLIKRIIANCVTCNRLKKLPQQQLMGQLPTQRTEAAPAFTHVGLDVFGPFYVRERRSELKRWGLMVSCLFSRAVHIEILEDLTSDSLIQALRCVIAVRGTIKSVTSDNGTNFVGAQNEMEKAWKSGDMQNYLLTNRITWKFNAPLASNQGGATERMIRSARAVLSALALKHKGRMDTKTLRTALLETTNIINSRPLTATNLSSPNEQIITPNLLLHMKNSEGAPPPAEFPPEEIYGKKRWKIAQAIASEFWEAWKTEYLSAITLRQKWTKERENLKPGDIVMLVDSQTARCDWKVGMITSTSPGADGLVRNVEVKLATKSLDSKGRRMTENTILRRPVNKVAVLLKQ